MKKDMECRAPISIIETLSPIASLLYCVILLLSRQDATAERLIGLEASCTIWSTRWKQQMNSQHDAQRHVNSWMLRTQEVCQYHWINATEKLKNLSIGGTAEKSKKICHIHYILINNQQSQKLSCTSKQKYHLIKRSTMGRPPWDIPMLREARLAQL
jgi:hypothetical protein